LHANRTKQVVKRLGESKPRHYIAIAHAFQRLVRLEVAKRAARIESVEALPVDVRERLKSDLQKKYGSELTIEFAQNPDLVGGMRVKVGSHVWDGSVRARLQTLRDRLT